MARPRRPVRNIAARSWCADVRRFFQLINADEVLGTHNLEGVILKGAWTGPAALCLVPHALAPVAELPVLEVVSAVHICADLTLGLGKVVYDYLQQPAREPLRIKQKALAI